MGVFATLLVVLTVLAIYACTVIALFAHDVESKDYDDPSWFYERFE